MMLVLSARDDVDVCEIQLDKAFHIYRTSQDVVQLYKAFRMNHSILNTTLMVHRIAPTHPCSY